VDEQEQAGGAGPVPPAADGATAPLPEPAAPGERPGRGTAARRALTGRAAGWVVAAVLAGVIIGLLVGFARSSPAVSVAQAGPARFTIGPAGLPGAVAGQGQVIIGPNGLQRQVIIGPNGVQRQVIIGPNGVQRQVIIGPNGASRQIVIGPNGASRQIVIGPAGLPPGAVIGPAGLPPGAVIVGPVEASGQVVACPPGVATGPVRVFLPAVPAKVSWWFVQLPAAASAQIPNWADPQMLLPPAGVTVHTQRVAAAAPVQVVVPPGQVRARLRNVAPGYMQITLPAGQSAVCPGGQ
jgi:hypothetical protein